MLETKKNLFLFFPYEFTFDKYHNKDEALRSISEAITEDFRASFEYRENQVDRQYDTFITCIYDNAFLIYFVQNQATRLIDIVETKKYQLFFIYCNMQICGSYVFDTLINCIINTNDNSVEVQTC